jgi:hypothetical protein
MLHERLGYEGTLHAEKQMVLYGDEVIEPEREGNFCEYMRSRSSRKMFQLKVSELQKNTEFIVSRQARDG